MLISKFIHLKYIFKKKTSSDIYFFHFRNIRYFSTSIKSYLYKSSAFLSFNVLVFDITSVPRQMQQLNMFLNAARETTGNLIGS